MTVVFCASEVFPYAKTGGLADVCGALPVALGEAGVTVKIFLPKYRCVDENRFGLRRVSDGVWSGSLRKNIQVYAVDRPDFYDRDGFYGDQQGDFPDNFQRFDYFCRRTLEILKEQGDPVDVIHCHDWQTGWIPLYVKYGSWGTFFDKTRTVFTIHNLSYQGLFPKELFGTFDFASSEILQQSGLYFYGKLSLLRAGIVSSDMVTTVSPQYAREIQTEALGCGMHDVLSARSNGVRGILNGLDYSIWDPEHDGLIVSRYSAQAPEGKALNKTELQLQAGLPARADVPVLGFVGRLSHQKGIDLIAESASSLLENDIQMVFLGVGDDASQKTIAKIADQYPNKVSVLLMFDEQMAHQIYAGSDFFLMPSVFEPCGLSQMISLCYGTIPIVYKTGGLADTVTDLSNGGNGCVFDEYTREAFVDAVFRAIDVFADSVVMDEARMKAFEGRFSWADAAGEYRRAYEELTSG